MMPDTDYQDDGIDDGDKDTSGVYLPSQEAIADEKAKIQAAWTLAEERQRQVNKGNPLSATEIKIVNTSQMTASERYDGDSGPLDPEPPIRWRKKQRRQ